MAGQGGPNILFRGFASLFSLQNSLFWYAGNWIKSPDCINTIRDFRSRRRPSFAKFPVFPCYQGIQRGDRFEIHWVVSQPMIYLLQGKLDLAYLSAQSFPKREETL
jgi:hypothetical protein